MTGPKKGSRGRAPKRNTAQGRGGITRDSTRPVRREKTGSGAEQGANPARRKPGEREEGKTGERSFKPGPARQAPPKVAKKKPLPELKRVQLDAPPPDTVFRDRDGEALTFPESALKRVAARLLTEKNKAWRYRAFPFPLFTDRGSEQAFSFDFYIYDAEDSVIRLLLVVPFESREVWDRVGRFKRQYPMYRYELWTPEKLAQLQGPRGRLDF
ncbi:hypothetical protein E5F05_16565 [Deinococcus metallilatus]|uniref:Uncharacterized protein n=1 Tax=Deinococcus metallilatus TaxID=1211322 RepID=A0AAJ5F5A4_9DEIO|nr:hypothetical protein [Deinococcus metallilatus]MBB5294877.1 hypothetical protein [Deinococcus metallilatus]QBY09410.1 hypothetical protein E5F05_16565 [Deinococcus metallilatus]RXJ09415.1 hypothetical protein ERJ73_15405 [Deinococcus metallilatus]TLK28938.1 hypothetical protein FCS05_07170 [Deinococcus metallilatus]GMA16804.1 hypothetical protein GCM10025871_31350 [Deinococcus metallilatus]